MSDINFKSELAHCWTYDSEDQVGNYCTIEDLYQAFKARLIEELQVSSGELLYPAELEGRNVTR